MNTSYTVTPSYNSGSNNGGAVTVSGLTITAGSLYANYFVGIATQSNKLNVNGSYYTGDTANTPNTIVARDASGNFSANYMYGTTQNADYVNNDYTSMRFHWSVQSGQPTWLWGGSDGANMYVYNPSNFSVSYASSAGSSTNASYAGYAGSAGYASSSGSASTLSSYTSPSFSVERGNYYDVFTCEHNTTYILRAYAPWDLGYSPYDSKMMAVTQPFTWYSGIQSPVISWFTTANHSMYPYDCYITTGGVFKYKMTSDNWVIGAWTYFYIHKLS